MKKQLIIIGGMFIIISAVLLGLSSKEANDCTCGDYTAYQPNLFIMNLQTYLNFDGRNSTLCEPTEGCRARVVPIFVDLYLLGATLIVWPLIKNKR